jgi:hypothetical protein
LYQKEEEGEKHQEEETEQGRQEERMTVERGQGDALKGPEMEELRVFSDTFKRLRELHRP